MVASNIHEAYKASSQSVVHPTAGRLMLHMCPKVISMISSDKDNNNRIRGDREYVLGLTISPRSESNTIFRLVV